MTAATATQAGPAPKTGQRALDFHLFLILFCVFLEFARPTAWSFNLPIMATGYLFFKWFTSSTREWSPQCICFLVFLAIMALHVPFAENYFFAFWTTFLMAVTLGLCIPIMHFLDTLPRFEMVAICFMLAACYVGVWAIGHDGWGPLGAAAGQDQNYVALEMAAALPIPYFYLFLSKGFVKKAALGAITVAYVLAVVIGFSRGGFVGLVAVAFYCWVLSPKKIIGILVVVAVSGIVLAWAPSDYWDEMGTISDTSEGGTADHRFELWKIAVEEYKDNPVFGVGPANYRWEAGKYQTQEQWEKFDRSLAGGHFTHSLYFELLAEMGSVGVYLFFAVCFYNMRDIRDVARMKPRPGQDPEEVRRARYLAMAMGGTLIGFLVASIFLSTLYAAYFWFLTAMVVALRHLMLGPANRPVPVPATSGTGSPPRGSQAPRQRTAAKVRG